MQNFFVAITLVWFCVFNANAQQSPVAFDAFSGDTYTPMDASETLWRISTQYNTGKSFTVYQTMLAIYQLNPGAFKDGDINSVTSGAILKMPSDQYISDINPEFAKNKVLGDPKPQSRSQNQVISVQGNNNRTQSVQANLDALNPSTSSRDADIRDSEKEKIKLSPPENAQQSVDNQQLSEAVSNLENLIAENRQYSEDIEGFKLEIAELKARIDVNANEQTKLISDLKKEVNALKTLALSQPEASPSQTGSSNMLIAIVGAIGLILIGYLGYIFIGKSKKENDENSAVLQPSTTLDDTVASDDTSSKPTFDDRKFDDEQLNFHTFDDDDDGVRQSDSLSAKENAATTNSPFTNVDLTDDDFNFESDEAFTFEKTSTAHENDVLKGQQLNEDRPQREVMNESSPVDKDDFAMFDEPSTNENPNDLSVGGRSEDDYSQAIDHSNEVEPSNISVPNEVATNFTSEPESDDALLNAKSSLLNDAESTGSADFGANEKRVARNESTEDKIVTHHFTETET